MTISELLPNYLFCGLHLALVAVLLLNHWCPFNPNIKTRSRMGNLSVKSHTEALSIRKNKQENHPYIKIKFIYRYRYNESVLPVLVSVSHFVIMVKPQNPVCQEIKSTLFPTIKGTAILTWLNVLCALTVGDVVCTYVVKTDVVRC